jgi:hypothetical protein
MPGWLTFGEKAWLQPWVLDAEARLFGPVSMWLAFREEAWLLPQEYDADHVWYQSQQGQGRVAAALAVLAIPAKEE